MPLGEEASSREHRRYEKRHVDRSRQGEVYQHERGECERRRSGRFSAQEELKGELNENREADAEQQPRNPIVGLPNCDLTRQKGRYGWEPEPEGDSIRPNI